jgi:hypothetical protein
MIPPLHKEALEYIRNTGGEPEVAWFDEDHAPIGPELRRDLTKAGLVKIEPDPLGDRITLTAEGAKALA